MAGGPSKKGTASNSQAKTKAQNEPGSSSQATGATATPQPSASSLNWAELNLTPENSIEGMSMGALVNILLKVGQIQNAPLLEGIADLRKQTEAVTNKADQALKEVKAVDKKVKKLEQTHNTEKKDRIAEAKAEKEVVIHNLEIASDATQEEKDDKAFQHLAKIHPKLKRFSIKKCYVPSNLGEGEDPKAIVSLMSSHTRQTILGKYDEYIEENPDTLKITAGRTKKERAECSRRYELYKDCDKKNAKSRGEVFYRVGKKKAGDQYQIHTVKQGEEGWQALKDAWEAAQN